MYDPTVTRKVIKATIKENHLTCFPSPLSGKKGIKNAHPMGKRIDTESQGKLEIPPPNVPNVCSAKCVKK